LRAVSVKFPVFILLFFILKTTLAVDVYYKLASFYIPKNGPFIETSLTIPGKTAGFKKVPSGYQNAVNVSLLISDEQGKIVVANKYNLNGPVFTDTSNVPVFIDHQRYPLASGSYTLELEVTDKVSLKKPFKLVQKFKMNYSAYTLQVSSIQLLESFKKADKPGPITKSGYDLVPFNVDYYPESQNKLAFYFETYNADSVFGKNKGFIYKYYIENNDTYKALDDFSAFKKAMAAPVNPLLAQFDISRLPTGNYNLVIELRDEKNIIQVQEKYFFQRRNRNLEPLVEQPLFASSELTIDQYFRRIKSPDTLKIFVECLWPISDMKERDRQINQSLKKDTTLMRNYLIDYWTSRAGDSVSPMKIWMEYLKSVNEAEAMFKCGKQKGYYSDRGRVYLQYGKPNQRTVMPNEANTFPYEIWQYYRIYDKTNGQFFTNKRFVFVNKNIADDCHRLEHSDMRGEVNNERWRYEVMKRQMDGIQNDQNNPNGSSNNQFDDFFINPR
jgi:GWxTD domain-containing protein